MPESDIERFRRTLAYHEAGHALCHSLLGLGSGGASIVRDKPTHTLGRALRENRPEPFRPHKGMRGGFVDCRAEEIAARKRKQSEGPDTR